MARELRPILLNARRVDNNLVMLLSFGMLKTDDEGVACNTSELSNNTSEELSDYLTIISQYR